MQINAISNSGDAKEKSMSDNEQQFWDLVDEQIGSANEKTETQEPSLVGDAMLYAAARFNVYLTAASATERKEFKDGLGETKAMLMAQFETMLDANLEDYLENYKVFLGR